MNLAFITAMSGSSWGGSEALWAATAYRALDAGHNVLVSVYDWPENAARLAEFERRGAQLHLRRASKRWRRSNLLNRFMDPFDGLLEFAPHAALVSQGGTYDISSGGEMSALRHHLTVRRDWPYVLLCHCEQPPPQRSSSLAYASRVFQNAALVGMLSRNLHARTEQDLAIRLDNVRFFQNPLNIANVGVLPWPCTEPLRMAFVGRLDAVKGLQVLLRVLGSEQWKQRNWQLDVHGDGPDRAQLEAQSLSYGLREKVRFAGFVHDIRALWRSHHVLVMPSQREGVPNALLEAMLCGRPAVVTKVGGVEEWVHEGESGFLADRSDVASIDVALNRMWEQRAELQQLGQAAHDQVLAKRDNQPESTLLRWLEDLGKMRANALPPLATSLANGLPGDRRNVQA